MSIYDKIEEIRQMPEEKRIRYVWLAVAVCMFFLLIIWFFSSKELISERKDANFSNSENFLINENNKTDNSGGDKN